MNTESTSTRQYPGNALNKIRANALSRKQYNFGLNIDYLRSIDETHFYIVVCFGTYKKTLKLYRRVL